MNEIETYTLIISTDEMYDARMDERGMKLIDAVKAEKDFVGVYQDPAGKFQMFLFKTPEARDNVHHKLQQYFGTCVVTRQSVFVDEKYISKN